MPSTPITPPFLPSLGLMGQSRQRAGLDRPLDPNAQLPPVQPLPFGEPQRWDPRTMPMRPREGVTPLNPANTMAGGVQIPPSGPGMFPSGFDPTAQTPGSMSYGGPQLGGNAGALAGLKAMQPSPRGPLGVYGSEEELYKQASGMGNAPWSQAMARRQLNLGQEREDFGIEQAQTAEEAINKALQGQHPAVLGLGQLQAEQKALPQQLQAAGTISAARQRAQGDVAAAEAQAAGKAPGDQMTFINNLMERLNQARQQSREFSGSRFSQFEEPNRLNEQDYQMLINAMLQRLNVGGQ